MDINKLLEGTDCVCGKKHTCDIKYVYIEKNAVRRLCEVCSEYRHILLVADENTFSAAGEAVTDALSQKIMQNEDVPVIRKMDIQRADGEFQLKRKWNIWWDCLQKESFPYCLDMLALVVLMAKMQPIGVQIVQL